MCPNCKQNTFSIWDKMTMAPLKPKKCKNCGALIKPKFLPFLFSLIISQIFMIFTILFILKLLSPLGLSFIWTISLSVVLGVILSSLVWIKLHTKFIPLKVVQD